MSERVRIQPNEDDMQILGPLLKDFQDKQETLKSMQKERTYLENKMRVQADEISKAHDRMWALVGDMFPETKEGQWNIDVRNGHLVKTGGPGITKERLMELAREQGLPNDLANGVARIMESIRKNLESGNN